MPRVIFTDNIQRHLHCPPSQTDGRTVGEALADFFRKHPQARSYVLDDQGAVRKHVVIFVDGLQIQDRRGLGDAVEPNAEVYVMQALSGG
jgi:molybdopterin synthase sulfur carrier subunit